jgi:fatty-acid desaturase
MINQLFRGTSKNSQYVMIVQVILGILGSFYFIYKTEYIFFLYSFLMFSVIMHFCHNVGLHRYFSHNSFKTSKFWHVCLSLSTPLACAGSPYGYAMAHRAHHIYSDTDKDPHSKNRGFLKIAFFDWNLKGVPIKVMAKLNEKWILMGHNYYVLIISFFYFILLTIDIKLGIMYNVAVLFLWIGYIFINILDHMNFPLGYRNFETNDNSTNNLYSSGYFFLSIIKIYLITVRINFNFLKIFFRTIMS